MPAGARAEKPAAAVLDVQAHGVPKALTVGLTKALRATLRADGGYRVVEPSASLAELRLVLDCASPTPGCWQALAQSLNVQVLFVAEVRREGGAYKVDLLRYDGVTGNESARAQARLTGKPAQVIAAFEQDAARFVRGLAVGTLEVRAEPSPAAVFIGDEPRGQTPATLELAPGAYVVEVRRDGHRPFRAQVSVIAGTTTDVTAHLESLIAPPPPPPARIRPATWVTWGGAAAALAAGVVLGVMELSTQSDYNAITPRTRADVDRMGTLHHRADNYGLGTNIAFGVGGAAVVAAILLTYRDLHRSREAAPVRVGVGPGGLALAWTY
ncbi:MAG TPA: PEGA domain-containing protein [Polyangia bacterium]